MRLGARQKHVFEIADTRIDMLAYASEDKSDGSGDTTKPLQFANHSVPRNDPGPTDL
jgi:hypothetical protein